MTIKLYTENGNWITKHDKNSEVALIMGCTDIVTPYFDSVSALIVQSEIQRLNPEAVVLV